MPITDDELDRRLAALAAPSPRLDHAEARSIVRSALSSPKRRKTQRAWLAAGAIAVGSALVLPTAAVATAKLFEAQTGRFGQPGSLWELEGDEWIDYGAEDIDEYIVSIAPRDLPVPASFDWDGTAAAIAHQYARMNEDVVDAQGQRLGIALVYEQELWLAWLREWIEADRAGDAPRRDAALAVLAEIPDWPSIVAADGGGNRITMWSYVARLASDDPTMRRDAAQALLQRKVIMPVATITGTPAEMTHDGRAVGIDEAMAALTPTQAALYGLWDGVDRTSVIDEINTGYAAGTADMAEAAPGSQWWADHDRAMREVAAAAGHPNPKPSMRLQPDEGGGSK